jgi:hypothetical protein
MLKTPGDSLSNTVDRLVMSSGISLRLRHSQVNLSSGGWLQVGLYALFIRHLWTSASTATLWFLTSVKAYLYPLSTTPITITTNFNKLITI